MTAQEYFKEEISGVPLTQDWVVEHLIKFAKHHVAKALESASENADLTVDSYESMQEGSVLDIDKKSILDAYPLEEIK